MDDSTRRCNSRKRRSVRPGLQAIALIVAMVLLGSSPILGEEASANGSRAGATDLLALLPLQTSEGRIVDTAGREVLLRGANLNALGDYWQGVASLPPNLPVTDRDWQTMAAHGFSVVRLVISWSLLEPHRGVFDSSYLDRIEAAVDAAAARGIYTVIDMHQDAFSKFTATPEGTSCPSGTSRSKGWDGAPEWAVLTDGASTCRPRQDRNSAPAVVQAWNNFYDNTDGIRDHFVETWGFVAERFAGNPAVAGYDLLNEPDTSRPSEQLQAPYDHLIAQLVARIRSEEAHTSFDHLIFIEPALPAGNLSNGLVIPTGAGIPDRSNLVGATHNYAESIQEDLPIEVMNNVIASFNEKLGIPQWTGEYGWWDPSAKTLDRIEHFAALEDERRWGSAWWQWRQSCGDPHTLQFEDGKWTPRPDGGYTLIQQECPANTEVGPYTPFLDVLGRAYPRAAPGQLRELRSDPDTGDLLVTASATRSDGELVVWVPEGTADDRPIVTSNLTGLRETRVEGGRIVTARVERVGDYALGIGVDLPAPSAPPSTVQPADSTPPAPAEAMRGYPDYTG